MRVLGLSGSLRGASTNSQLLLAAEMLAPDSMDFQITQLIGALPLFNPDAETSPSAPVASWIEAMRQADGIVVSTPEYARGYPGALKNALDWLVNTDAFVHKPFMLLNASKRGVVAQQTLTVVLQTMSGLHIAEADADVALLGTQANAEWIVSHAPHAQLIRTALLRFAGAITANPAS